MGDREATLRHEFLQIPVAQRIAQVPPNAQDDDLILEMAPSEQRWPRFAHLQTAYQTASECLQQNRGDFVPQEKVSMRKVKEVLRLRFGLGLQQNQIARSCSIGQATVHRYLDKPAAAGLSWPLPEDLDDHRLEELLFPVAAGRPSKTIRSLPDFAEVRRQLQAYKHLTLQLPR
jgi:predicted DNA-binding protein (UPF0251 family)